jgi:NitT/TauT family transport system substrate-binding protein
MLGRVAEAEHFDASSVTLRPVQQIANMVAAVGSGQVDATIAIASMAKPLAASGQAHIIGWAGDIVPYQITAVFTTARMTEQHADLLHRFARAYQKGLADYREAFLRLDAQGAPIVDASTDAVIPLITTYVFTGDPRARDKIIGGVGYYDEGAALDVADVIAQLRWFKAQDLVKGDADPQSVMDTRFLPTR